MTRGRVALALALLLTAGLVSAVAKQKDKPTSKVAQPMQPVGSDYVISPGDVLEVQVWKEPDVSKAVPVRPDGKISLPLLDDVQAAGRTSAALTADLTERLKKFISDPQVTVIVTEVNSQRIYITGEVTRGGTYPLEPGMTVLQGLSSAGGFTPFANVKKIYVLRQQNGKQVKYPFNYKDVVKGTDTAQNILLQPGDTIVVP
ncbi:MAG TPA: polysaccharide biosynthesis/export family protein [Terriglobia bacterium]|jgi:polysaccharide export outer membrane protein|nr:polysaccharide biosynthesis/export family protein [Terriglobia bacterium]